MKIPRRVLERRKSVRIAENLFFKIGHEGYDIQAITINISAHGALCVVDQEIALMTQLKMGFELPTPGKKRKAIHLKGVVVRKDKDPRTGRFLIAIYFSAIKPQDQKNLTLFIDRYLKS